MSEPNLDVDQLAEFIFDKNEKNSKIALEIDADGGVKDLFSFCLELLCKGLFIIIGKRQSIDLSNINMDQFHQVTERLLLAGIKVDIEIVKNTGNLQPVLNIIEKKNPQSLTDYVAQVISSENIYNIKFDITRI